MKIMTVTVVIIEEVVDGNKGMVSTKYISIHHVDSRVANINSNH